MYDVSAQGIDERMINVHYCYYQLTVFSFTARGTKCSTKGHCLFVTWKSAINIQCRLAGLSTLSPQQRRSQLQQHLASHQLRKFSHLSS